VKIALHEMEWEGNPQSVDDRQEQALDSQAGFSAHSATGWIRTTSRFPYVLNLETNVTGE